MNKSEIKSTEEVLKKIILQPVETIELEEQILPKIEELTYSNKSYKLKCSILFIDIRESTQMSKDISDKNMLKIYKSFIRVATQCVRYSGGYTRQFLGDRIMGVFLDELDEDGNRVKKSADKAISAAREMNTYIDFILNRLINENIKGKYIKCGIGICTGNVLLAQVGMKGVEQDEAKQNEKGDVWVGYITNQASKFADLTKSREIFIDENTHKELSEENKKYDEKEIWHIEKRIKGNKKYKGFIAKDLYVTNINELEIERYEYKDDKSDINQKIYINYEEMIKDIQDLIEKYKLKEIDINEKEKQLQLKEAKLNEKEKSIEKNIKNKEYDLLYDIIYNTYMNIVKIKEMGRKYWLDIIDRTIKKGEEIGKSKIKVIEELSNPLIEIYMDLEMYDEAYKVLIIHVNAFSYLPYKGIEVIKQYKSKSEILKILREKLNTINDISNKMDILDYIKEIESLVF